MAKAMIYEQYLRNHDLLDNGFAYRELVSLRGLHRKIKPPPRLWSRMPPTLLLAHILRERMIERGARGLRVNAAYRPYGGSRNSQHKQNAALDLDLLRGDYDMGAEYYEEAARLFSEFGKCYSLGLGFYGPTRARESRRPYGIRVHIDTGWRMRAWWGRNRSPVWQIMDNLGLKDPRR